MIWLVIIVNIVASSLIAIIGAMFIARQSE